jgi:hypothetical protein
MNSSQCAMRATLADLLARRAGLREADVVDDRPVEQEVVLQHDADHGAVVAQSIDARSRPSTVTRPASGG